MSKTPHTKQENIVRNRKRFINQGNIKRHREEAEKLFVSDKGFVEENTEGSPEDWRTQLKSMRGSLSKSKSRLRKRGQSVFR